jgi:hypothetical protein
MLNTLLIMQPIKENSIDNYDRLKFVISVVGAHCHYWPPAAKEYSYAAVAEHT